jgi:hypothetical protein
VTEIQRHAANLETSLKTARHDVAHLVAATADLTHGQAAEVLATLADLSGHIVSAAQLLANVTRIIERPVS